MWHGGHGRRGLAPDGGGCGAEPSVAMRRAFYEPFEKETGIAITAVPHAADPVTQFKLMVDARSYIWDVCMLNSEHVARLDREGRYFEP
ncbi:hypothetical protein RAA17_00570 [Komagataeibacter rhaeticus]|nr:hypothetical protein [Komagataeibacter rhaeticus]